MRCACCDKALKSSEVIWYPAQQRHEDLCKKCRSEVFTELYESGFDVERIGMQTEDLDND
jgi:hypothetical protein